jgi:hypothetical protein
MDKNELANIIQQPNKQQEWHEPKDPEASKKEEHKIVFQVAEEEKNEDELFEHMNMKMNKTSRSKPMTQMVKKRPIKATVKQAESEYCHNDTNTYKHNKSIPKNVLWSPRRSS